MWRRGVATAVATDAAATGVAATGVVATVVVTVVVTVTVTGGSCSGFIRGERWGGGSLEARGGEEVD